MAARAKIKRRRPAKKLKMVCPKRAKGHAVHRMRNGNCYIKLKTGQRRFVKKVRSRRKKR